jgi:hypothetical protein
MILVDKLVTVADLILEDGLTIWIDGWQTDMVMDRTKVSPLLNPSGEDLEVSEWSMAPQEEDGKSYLLFELRHKKLSSVLYKGRHLRKKVEQPEDSFVHVDDPHASEMRAVRELLAVYTDRASSKAAHDAARKKAAAVIIPLICEPDLCYPIVTAAEALLAVLTDSQSNFFAKNEARLKVARSLTPLNDIMVDDAEKNKSREKSAALITPPIYDPDYHEVMAVRELLAVLTNSQSSTFEKNAARAKAATLIEVKVDNAEQEMSHEKIAAFITALIDRKVDISQMMDALRKENAALETAWRQVNIDQSEMEALRKENAVLGDELEEAKKLILGYERMERIINYVDELNNMPGGLKYRLITRDRVEHFRDRYDLVFVSVSLMKRWLVTNHLRYHGIRNIHVPNMDANEEAAIRGELRASIQLVVFKV